MLSERIVASGDPEAFVTGCAVSSFKYTAGENCAQYAELCKKVASGAQFAITQLGYDIRKFDELIRFQRQTQMTVPTLASLYLLTPKAAGLPGLWGLRYSACGLPMS
jgi:methylenetetrahydrofolate reductase (NADPH)